MKLLTFVFLLLGLVTAARGQAQPTAPLYVHLLSPKHVLSGRIYLGQPLYVRGNDNLRLTGNIELRGTNLMADLQGSVGAYGTSYQGEVILEKAHFPGGGAFSGVAGELWFAVSTNANCTHIIESLKKSQPSANPDQQTFLLNFPKSVDITGVQIEYFLTGPFGGVGNHVISKPNLHQYWIDTTSNGKPADALKAIVYCPGYSLGLIDAPALKDPAARIASVDLKPFPSIPLTGKVVAPAGQSLLGFKLELTYEAVWGMNFFGYIDGMAPSFTVAQTGLAPDGSFSITIPDFARDPVISKFEQRTLDVLKLTLRDPKTGNFPYDLVLPESLGQRNELKIRTEYPTPLILQIHSKHD